MASLVPTSVLDICQSPYGCAIFLKALDKIFVIYVDRARGCAMQSAFEQEKTERPLSYEFVWQTLDALDCGVDSVVIYREDNGIFFTFMRVSMNNELGSKIAEIDGRPSDTLAVALKANVPIYIRSDVLEKLPDVSQAYAKIKGE